MTEIFQNIAKGTDDDIAVVRAYISDNMEQSGGVLDEDAVWKYIKDIINRPVEYEARIEGTPKHFAGLVFEELDRDVHISKRFDVPISWSFYEGVDPAEGKPVAWGFFAVSHEEFELTNHRTINKVYWIDYLALSGMPLSDMVRAVNVKRAEWGYKKPIWTALDSKYGLRSQNTGDDKTNWYNELRKYDVGVNYVLSKSNPGSVETGESIVKEYLKPKWNNLIEKSVPTLVIFDNCEDPINPFNPITHMFSYAKDEDKPSKRTEEYKDFPDLLRYVLERYPRYWNKEKTTEKPKVKKYFRRS